MGNGSISLKLVISYTTCSLAPLCLPHFLYFCPAMCSVAFPKTRWLNILHFKWQKAVQNKWLWCILTPIKLSLILQNQRPVHVCASFYLHNWTCNRFLQDASFSTEKDIMGKQNGQNKWTIKRIIKDVFWCFWACTQDTCGVEPSDWLSRVEVIGSLLVKKLN